MKTNARMISLILNALGLMRVSEHEAATRDLKAAAARDIEPLTAEKANLEFSLSTYKTSLAARTKALDTCEDQNEKLETIIAELQDEIAELRPDATLWRNARDKRAKNRGGGK